MAWWNQLSIQYARVFPRGHRGRVRGGWRSNSANQAAATATTLAEIYVKSIASLSAAGNLIVTVQDTYDSYDKTGMSWQTVINALPLLAHLPAAVKSLNIKIPASAAKPAQEIKLSGKTLEEFSQLSMAEREAIVKQAAALDPDKVSKFIATEVDTAVGGGTQGNVLRVLNSTCFVGGTPILTPDGEKSIEAFRVGDLVLSRPEHEPSAARHALVPLKKYLNWSPPFWSFMSAGS